MTRELDCDRIDALLAARGEGELSEESAAELAAHLAACDDCRAFAATLAAATAVLPNGPVFPIVAEGIYELGSVIGRGGMGQIRIARDLRLGRQVAVKELLYNTAALSARFVREARIAASLQHPNIVPIYDVGCWTDGTPFYAMRLVTGRTLFRAIGEAGSFEDRMQFLPSLIAAADAVAFAHSEGVVHRDLTPANLLLGEFGETVVIDWGLAKDTRIDLERVAPQYRTGMTNVSLTVRGDVIGSPAYMPCEQAAGEPADERADVYALGAILYHVLSGRAPYTAATAREVIAKVRAAAPPPLDRVASRAPRALVAIVNKAMAREAAGRYANARELARELRRFQAGALADAQRAGTLERIGRWFGRDQPVERSDEDSRDDKNSSNM